MPNISKGLTPSQTRKNVSMNTDESSHPVLRKLHTSVKTPKKDHGSQKGYSTLSNNDRKKFLEMKKNITKQTIDIDESQVEKGMD